jgi:serine/threonine-protein kinase
VARYTAYCRGCNQDFPATDADRCPQCGDEMMVASDHPTVDLAETMPPSAPATSVDTDFEAAPPLIGTELGLYRIDALLGRGGMAWVFRAHHNMLHRPCAIKVLNQDLVRRQPQAIEMFLSEARAAASLVHPHVVTVHNVGEDGPHNFIELEYIPGQSLQSLRATQGTLPPIEATGYLLQSCSALAAAHQQGMVHRDFKPANIMVRHDGVAKLADFGLAKRVIVGEAASDQGLSGTPYFMAPELFRGSPGSPASDVYAVGVSYFYLLTGTFPFTSRHIVRLEQLHAEQPVPDPRTICPDVPEAAAATIRRALAKRPEDRYPDGEAIAADLQSVFTQLRTLRSIVDEAMIGLGARIESQPQRLAVTVPLPGGRNQTVYVEEATVQPWSTTIVRVYSNCGPAQETYYRKALELNARVPHGSLAIEQIQGVDHFVMLHSFLRATCAPLEIRHALQDIARWADDVEHALTGHDQF